MATQTSNLGLTKPDGTDKVLILVLNGNFDKIDEAIGALRAQQIPPEVITKAVEDYLSGREITGGATEEQAAQIAANKQNIEELTRTVEELDAEDVGARPNTWMPTAAQVGARPNTWMPSASDVGARPNTWVPTAQEVGAMPSTYVAPVTSVNGKTGAVNIDVGVTSVNGKSGAVSLPLPKMAMLQYDAEWDSNQNAVKIPVSAFTNPASTTDASKLCFMLQVYGKMCIVGSSFVSGGNLYIRLYTSDYSAWGTGERVNIIYQTT